jgi:hypothetical protein
MSDLQDVIVSSSIRAFNAGLATGIIQEQERIISLLEPLAECDKEVCGPDGETHYGLDCDAFTFQYAINLIEGDDNGKDG